ncbi:MAG TPA: type II secretion system F family protein [Candidatus Babeliales bacterium]|jgi:type II secretory pathway component PulF|nr:type II secretion system F family protein [Candidatus Babeliales bacterium]
MALYAYEAFSKEGKKVNGVIDAPSAEALREQLTKQGLFPIKIELSGGVSTAGFFKRLFEKKVTTKDKILLTKQLAILLKSGVPILQAIETLIEQFEGGVKNMLVRIKDDVKEGTSLADALAKYPKVFERIYIQLVRAGEATGKLETILERLTVYLERREATTKKVKGALQQPIIQLVVAIGVVGVLVMKVVPQLAQNFASQKQELPGPTQFILSLSNFMISYFYIIIIGVIAVIALFKFWKATPTGGRQWDQLKLKLPLIKYLSKTNAVVQFSYTLGLLLEGGVNIAEALDIVVSVIDNRVLAAALRTARDNIVKEGKIAEYLQQTKMFPPIAIYLIKTGEQSGQLDKMLLTVADTYEKEYVELIDTMTGLISPIMLVVMAVVVGFIVLAIAMPMMQQIQNIG